MKHVVPGYLCGETIDRGSRVCYILGVPQTTTNSALTKKIGFLQKATWMYPDVLEISVLWNDYSILLHIENPSKRFVRSLTECDSLFLIPLEIVHDNEAVSTAMPIDMLHGLISKNVIRVEVSRSITIQSPATFEVVSDVQRAM